jgi:hypothetical protein
VLAGFTAGPFAGLFFWETTECPTDEGNVADVRNARPNIVRKEKRRAIVVASADEKRRTVGSGSRRGQRDSVGGA